MKGKKVKFLESKFSSSWILLGEYMTIREKEKMCSVKIRNDIQSSDSPGSCPQPQYFSNSSWSGHMANTYRLSSAQTLGQSWPPNRSTSRQLNYPIFLSGSSVMIF